MDVKSEIKSAVVDAVAITADSPAIAGINSTAIIPVAHEVNTAIAPYIAHLTNSEPWYQSRVTIGAIVAIAAQVAGPLLGWSIDGDTQTVAVNAIQAGGAALGGALALWGRWMARKPIGR